jgi:pyruvate/oxaloacetate carboxyltransferase
MAITTRSDRKTESIELAEVRLCPLVLACTGHDKVVMKMLEKHVKTGLDVHILFKFFDSLDLTNNIR